jgi:hypothetical protein
VAHGRLWGPHDLAPASTRWRRLLFSRCAAGREVARNAKQRSHADRELSMSTDPVSTNDASPRHGEPQAPVDEEVRRVDALARDVLRDDYLSFVVDRLELAEGEDGVTVKIDVTPSHNGARQLTGRGVGLVDAVFDAVLCAYAEEFPSLKTIAVADFQLGSGFDSSHGRRSDAVAVATLRVRNSHGVEFTFVQRSPSVTRSSARVALDALGFFINSERAYVQLHLAMKDATARRRSDLVQRFRQQMSTLVAATSYSEVIEKLRAAEG